MDSKGGFDEIDEVHRHFPVVGDSCCQRNDCVVLFVSLSCDALARSWQSHQVSPVSGFLNREPDKNIVETDKKIVLVCLLGHIFKKVRLLRHLHSVRRNQGDLSHAGNLPEPPLPRSIGLR